ncbi:MAG: hypothetical protein KBC00_02355 [Candidatus Levybacteria bacterium]|nr:hypothetical protein [Candidatus Levybacteria bacterium]MBP9815417.1 hypothetical protein [Candidatus Levybacteria bacterium]
MVESRISSQLQLFDSGPYQLKGTLPISELPHNIRFVDHPHFIEIGASNLSMTPEQTVRYYLEDIYDERTLRKTPFGVVVFQFSGGIEQIRDFAPEYADILFLFDEPNPVIDASFILNEKPHEVLPYILDSWPQITSDGESVAQYVAYHLPTFKPIDYFR